MIRNSLLRLFGLVLVTGVAWFVLTADWPDPGGGGFPVSAKFVLAVTIAVFGFLLSFRGDPFLGQCIYLAAGLLTIIILVVVALRSDFRGEVIDWIRLLVRGGSGFLSIAATTSAVLRILAPLSAGYEGSEREMRFGSKYEVYDYLLTVPAGAWGIPVGVATAVLVGVIVPGWRGVAIGLVSGIGAGALAWNSSVASVWGTVSGQPSLHRASAGAAIQAAIVAVAVIDSVIVGSGEVLGFVVSNVVELIFTLLIAGVLTQVLYIIQALLAMRGVGRLPVMALSALAGGALGVGAGLVAGELLVGGVSAGWVSNATEIVIVVLGGAVVAFVFQRLGAVVGFTATATIVAASGGSYGAIAATGAIGAVAGCVLAFIANVAIRLASDSIIFKGLVFILGITAGVVIGVRSGLPVTF